jgi:hypothetical protein
LSDAQSGEAIYAGQFRLNPDGAGRYYVLRFPPVAQAEGREFRLDLQAVEGTVGARVGYVDRLPGRLRLNEFPTPGDLDVGVYHRGPPGLWTLRLVGQRLLPDLVRTRVRQYKPAFFKGPAFGLLCAALAAGVGLLLWALAFTGIRTVETAPDENRARSRSPGFAAGIALIGLLLAIVIALRWNVAGMFGLGRRVALTESSTSHSSSLPAFPPPSSVRDLVARLAFVERAPEPRQVGTRMVTLEGRQRACIAVPARSEVTYGLRVPYDGDLRLGFALPEGATGASVFAVHVEGNTLLERTLVPSDAGVWHDVTLDLRPHGGRLAFLTLTTRPADVPAGFGTLSGESPPAGGALPVAGLWAAPHVVSERTWLLAYPLPEPPQVVQAAYFGDWTASVREIELLGYDVEWLQPAQGAHPHGALRLTLYWRALRPMGTSYTAFVHLLDDEGQIQGQWDSEPLNGTYPTDVWPQGAVIRDTYMIPHATQGSPTSVGAYRAAVGFYEWATMERLPAYDEQGARLADDRVMLDVLRPGQ